MLVLFAILIVLILIMPFIGQFLIKKKIPLGKKHCRSNKIKKNTNKKLEKQCNYIWKLTKNNNICVHKHQ